VLYHIFGCSSNLTISHSILKYGNLIKGVAFQDFSDDVTIQSHINVILYNKIFKDIFKNSMTLNVFEL